MVAYVLLHRHREFNVCILHLKRDINKCSLHFLIRFETIWLWSRPMKAGLSILQAVFFLFLFLFFSQYGSARIELRPPRANSCVHMQSL